MNTFITLTFGCVYLLLAIKPEQEVYGTELMGLMLAMIATYGWCCFIDWRYERKVKKCQIHQ